MNPELVREIMDKVNYDRRIISAILLIPFCLVGAYVEYLFKFAVLFLLGGILHIMFQLRDQGKRIK